MKYRQRTYALKLITIKGAFQLLYCSNTKHEICSPLLLNQCLLYPISLNTITFYDENFGAANDLEIQGMCVVELTVKLTLAMEGPFVNNISTISLFPAHAARCNGLDPLSSALLHEAS